jgi:hypothetical protein
MSRRRSSSRAPIFPAMRASSRAMLWSNCAPDRSVYTSLRSSSSPGRSRSGAAVAIVDVFLDEHVARGSDLPLELEHLALDRSVFMLCIGAHACIQHRSFHTTPLIPERRGGVESRTGDNRARVSVVEGRLRLGKRGQDLMLQYPRYKKDFDGWNETKKRTDSRRGAPFYHEREVWWCTLGVNVGSEENGSGESIAALPLF